jgi:hypothetical protein
VSSKEGWLSKKSNSKNHFFSIYFFQSRERKAGKPNNKRRKEERGKRKSGSQCSFVTDRGRGRGRGRVQKTEWWLVTNIATGQAQSTI